MRVGIWLPNCRHLATPAIVRRAAVRAEALGYELLAADGRELDEQMAAFAERARPRLS